MAACSSGVGTGTGTAATFSAVKCAIVDLDDDRFRDIRGLAVYVSNVEAALYESDKGVRNELIKKVFGNSIKNNFKSFD